MGALTSRQNAGVEEVDIVSNHAYKYPPKSGNYFGSHFIMGGERFDTPQPEAYLFGENTDLNFLGGRPTPFPYPPPQANEPTKTLKSLVNIRKESLRLVRAITDENRGAGNGPLGAATGDCKTDRQLDGIVKPTAFNIEFTFDSDARTAITIYYFCQEEITPNGLVYIPRDPSMTSDTYYYKKGSNQLFSQTSHVFDPSLYTLEELSYNTEKEIIPIAIHCVVQEGTEESRQSHTCIAVVEKHSDGTYMLKALKQKLFVDGLCYLLQEIYGIENKSNDSNKSAPADDEAEDNGSECVICICDVRDTLILPCRHLCLCNSCADSLRYQANNCPICRAPFRALLQIRALQRSGTQTPAAITPPQATVPPATVGSEGSCENIPAGYEAVSLIEALNGPCSIRNTNTNSVLPPPLTQQRLTDNQQLDTPTVDRDPSVLAADALNRCNLERSPPVLHPGSKIIKSVDNPDDYNARDHADNELSRRTPEFSMSVLLSRGVDITSNGKTKGGNGGRAIEVKEQNAMNSPLLAVTARYTATDGNHQQLIKTRQSRQPEQRCDTVRIVDETSADRNRGGGGDLEGDSELDSEAEKLSPLLDTAKRRSKTDSLPAQIRTTTTGTNELGTTSPTASIPLSGGGIYNDMIKGSGNVSVDDNDNDEDNLGDDEDETCIRLKNKANHDLVTTMLAPNVKKEHRTIQQPTDIKIKAPSSGSSVCDAITSVARSNIGAALPPVAGSGGTGAGSPPPSLKPILMCPPQTTVVDDHHLREVISNPGVNPHLQTNHHDDAMMMMVASSLTDNTGSSSVKNSKNHAPSSIGNNTSNSMNSAGDDSDYYTPEDPMTTILSSPVHHNRLQGNIGGNDKESCCSSLVDKGILYSSNGSSACDMNTNGGSTGLPSPSLPGTPLSNISGRTSSSGHHSSSPSTADSNSTYSSNGSTTKLLMTSDPSDGIKNFKKSESGNRY